jgi:hypothetical protein
MGSGRSSPSYWDRPRNSELKGSFKKSNVTNKKMSTLIVLRPDLNYHKILRYGGRDKMGRYQGLQIKRQLKDNISYVPLLPNLSSARGPISSHSSLVTHLLSIFFKLGEIHISVIFHDVRKDSTA